MTTTTTIAMITITGTTMMATITKLVWVDRAKHDLIFRHHSRQVATGEQVQQLAGNPWSRP
jgi:hypothetical protein